MIQENFKVFLSKFQGALKRVSRMFYGVSRVLQRCFDKEFSRGGLNETKEMSHKDRVLTASKTIWMLTSWHKTLVPALGS